MGGIASADAGPVKPATRTTANTDTAPARDWRDGFMTGTRVPSTALTARALDDVWRTVEPRLRRYLLARRVPAVDVDDVVQEVALRVLVHSPDYDGADDLLPWCITVARNVATDAVRAGARRAPADLTPDVPAADDVEGQVAARLELERTLAALKTLTFPDQRAIVEGIDQSRPCHDRTTSVRLAVRRHRARQRLLALLAAIAAWAWGSLRRLRPTTVVMAAGPLALAASISVALPSISVVPPAPAALRAPDVTRPPGSLLLQDNLLGSSLPAAGANATVHRSLTAEDPPRTPTLGASLPTGDGVLVHAEGEDTDRRRGSLCVEGFPVVGARCFVVADRSQSRRAADSATAAQAALSKAATAASSRDAGSMSS